MLKFDAQHAAELPSPKHDPIADNVDHVQAGVNGDKGKSLTFSDYEMRILAGICDTFVPSLEIDADPAGLYKRKASDLNVPDMIATILPAVSSDTNLLQLKLALHLFNQAWFNGLMDRNPRAFLDMTLEERTGLLLDWAESGIALRRKAFQALKRLTLFFFYTALDEQNCNPNWLALRYPGPPTPPTPTQKSIRPLLVEKDTTLETDVVIIGSGAGGGVVAGELTAAGLDVIILEKGDYYTESDYSGHELTSTRRLFDRQGFLATEDLGIVLLAGSTLGGGTTINWSASLRPPEYVLQEWENHLGVTGFTGKTYQKALDAVSQRMNVNTNECAANFQNDILVRGGNALGYTVGTIPRNVKGCEDCGFCNYGCQFGAKQGTLKTYLQDAYSRGARIIVNAHTDRVLVQNGQAVGVEATVQSQPQIKVKVKAKAVVVAAGSIHTPAVLLRSGLTNAHIGRNLHLHPATVVSGIYDQPVLGWSGVIMSRYITQFSNLDAGYGVTLETAPVHPGLAALVFPFETGLQHKRSMENITHFSDTLILTRDRDGGQVKLDKYGNPAIYYQVSAYDAAHMMRGIIEAMRIQKAAGARTIGAPHTLPNEYHTDGNGDFEAYLQSVQAAGWKKNTLAVMSAHQMSSCRMGGNPARGAIDPGGESFEVGNLFVADGSALPTASGVNPMLTIMGVAHVIAQNVKARFKR